MNLIRQARLATAAILATAAVVLGGSALAGGDGGDNLRAAVHFWKWVFSTAIEINKCSEVEKKEISDFVAMSHNGVVLLNDSSWGWSFGFVDGVASEVAPPQSGSLQIGYLEESKQRMVVKGARHVTRSNDNIDLPARGASLILVPLPEKDLLGRPKDFFRVCYLEDQHKARLYFNLVLPAGASQPTFGIAAQSLKKLNTDMPFMISELGRRNLYKITNNTL